MSMPALSLWQPWASLMACGAKTIETRPPWAMRLRSFIGHDIAICSTASTPRLEFGRAMLTDPFRDALVQALPDEDPEAVVLPETYPAGAVLAVVRVREVLPMVLFPASVGYTPCVVVHDHGADLWHPSEEPEAAPNVGLITEIEEHHFGNYEAGRVAVVTDNLRRLERPVPVRGRQQVWNLPADVEADVWAQVSR